MERKITVLYCFCILACVSAAIVEKNATNLTQQEFFIPGDDLVQNNKTQTDLKQGKEDMHRKKSVNKSSLQDSDSKINETELYENGQAAKVNSERSFILINQKYKPQKLDPQPLQKNSLFGVYSQPNDEVFKISENYFSPVPAPIRNVGEYVDVEVHKKPLVRLISLANHEKSNDFQPVKEYFRFRDGQKSPKDVFNVEDSAVPIMHRANEDLSHYEFQGQHFHSSDINKSPHQSIEDNVNSDEQLRSPLNDEISNNENENPHTIGYTESPSSFGITPHLYILMKRNLPGTSIVII